MTAPDAATVAIVSAEFGLGSDLPIYCGGLGILAGDWLKSSADLHLPVVGVGIAYHEGYFRQILDHTGWQHEQTPSFHPEEHGLHLLETRTPININGRTVQVGAYEHQISGRTSSVPLYLLTTNLPENSPGDRSLTARLYHDGDNKAYLRTAQYRILAASVRLLQDRGYPIETYHINEGHGALVALELLNMGLSPDQVREKLWFTTHTPLEAAFDRFPLQNENFPPSSVKYVLPEEWKALEPYCSLIEGQPHFGTAELATALSRGINGVSRMHADVSRGMKLFKGKDLLAITNGIHLPTWVHPAKAALYDSQFPGIFADPSRFKEMDALDYTLFRQAHQQAQAELFALIERETGVAFDPGCLTLGFARRGVEYKRAGLVLHNLEELAKILKGQAQIIFAGKAHPKDIHSKWLIQQVWQKCRELRERYGVKAAYIPNYDMDIGAAMVQGVDVWLNTPRRPLEASGTSGMKVAANGGINLSILDGWWAEAYDGTNGFAIAPENVLNDDYVDARSLLDLLKDRVLPAFRGQDWESLVKQSLKLAAVYNTDRNMQDYFEKAYKKREEKA